MKYPVAFDLALKKNPYKGKYIALEGVDGSGKSTQIENLKAALTKKGHDVISIRESKTPGPIGDLIRDALFQKFPITPEALQHLYVAQRYVLYDQIIIPSLKTGKIILADRCFWSAIPYGISDVLSEKETHDKEQLMLVAYGILSFYSQFIVPDVTFYIDISADTALQRLEATGKALDRYETKDKLSHTISLYHWLMNSFAQAFEKVNGEASPESITQEMIEKIEKSI